MLRSSCFIVALALGVTAVLAQTAGEQVFKQRKQSMEVLGESLYRTAGRMHKGTEPFDAAKAQAAFRVIAAEAPKLKALFPESSQKVADSRSAPAIWKNTAEFVARFDRLGAAASEAAAASKDAATFKAEYEKVNAACNSCHKDYRLPRVK